MKDKLKQFLSHSGLWSFYDEIEWARDYKKLKDGKNKTLSDWKVAADFQIKGEVFYILGSGYSVNHLQASHWEEVSRGMSIGFNNWFYHDFIPDIYGLELTKDPILNEVQISALSKSNPDLFERPLFLHFKHAQNSGFDLDKIPWNKSNRYFNLPFTLHTSNEDIVRKYIRKSVQFKNVDRLLHYSASVGMWADLAISLGYKKIVFVGIDMNDPRYFYHAPEYAEKASEFLAVQAEYLQRTSRNQSVHATADKAVTMRYGSLPVDEFLYMFRDELKKMDAEFEFYVSHSSSRLTKEFDVWEWKSKSAE